ncbi:hypothetical protein GXW83_15220 [Streptacidiphilus sp. PB12-B1b]|uniref:hypothetical protein n=1 Tax=Streptacidiphilus sp. PB12-B1b TaxID=2705012 RepID=UPI0015FC00C4|nr:hypothetical protein [Streptacidiphilus sp. PB12-B1b]QMU76879.1 hypothetical protein GXW83_15220 [Streptacidiphilus sp. PB12-B1b]
MAIQRRGRARSDDDGPWVMSTHEDGTPIRFKVVPENVEYVPDPACRAFLAEQARARGMTLLAYADWVGRMPKSQLHALRDRVKAGAVTEEEAALYYAWCEVLSVVVEKHQSLQRGWEGEPDRWM